MKFVFYLFFALCITGIVFTHVDKTTNLSDDEPFKDYIDQNVALRDSIALYMDVSPSVTGYYRRNILSIPNNLFRYDYQAIHIDSAASIHIEDIIYVDKAVSGTEFVAVLGIIELSNQDISFEYRWPLNYDEDSYNPTLDRAIWESSDNQKLYDLDDIRTRASTYHTIKFIITTLILATIFSFIRMRLNRRNK